MVKSSIKPFAVDGAAYQIPDSTSLQALQFALQQLKSDPNAYAQVDPATVLDGLIGETEIDSENLEQVQPDNIIEHINNLVSQSKAAENKIIPFRRPEASINPDVLEALYDEGMDY